MFQLKKINWQRDWLLFDNVLEKKIEVLEIDETPAFGIEPKIKIGVNGVVECK